jgi:hypothetical protein
LAAGATRSSIKYARVVLRTALSQAQRWHLVATNAARTIAPVKAEARAPGATVADLIELLDQAVADGALVGLGQGNSAPGPAEGAAQHAARRV